MKGKILRYLASFGWELANGILESLLLLLKTILTPTLTTKLKAKLKELDEYIDGKIAKIK